MRTPRGSGQHPVPTSGLQPAGSGLTWMYISEPHSQELMRVIRAFSSWARARTHLTSEPAKICHASSDFATRLRTK